MDQITDRLQRAAEYVRFLGYHPARISLHGSQNYGLAVEREDYHSDFDYKCIVLPSLWELTEEEKYASLTVEFEGGQIDVKDMRLFVKLIENMNPAYLESLLSPHALTIESGGQISQMRDLIPELFAQRGARFAKVCRKLFDEKGKRLYKESPAQAENIAKYGYDVKQAHHMYRLLVMLRAFEETCDMQLVVPMSERALLLDLKLGRIALDDVQRQIEAWRDEMKELEERITARWGKEKGQAARKMKQLGRMAVYEHCRKGAKDDGGELEI